ncbi:hypothetical protein HO906_07750 [Streptococcus suis]|nr:hypothetical protein [Streptococcus suis]
MTKEFTQTQVEELKQALKDKNNAPHHRKPTITTVANKVRFISNLQRFPEPLELCGGGSETVWE